jgi:hypothetical protein
MPQELEGDRKEYFGLHSGKQNLVQSTLFNLLVCHRLRLYQTGSWLV